MSLPTVATDRVTIQVHETVQHNSRSPVSRFFDGLFTFFCFLFTFFCFLFTFFCFLSGQYIHISTKDGVHVNPAWKAKARVVFSYLGLGMFVLQLCLCMGHIGLSIWVEVDRIDNITEIVNVTVNTSNESHINVSQNCKLPPEYWKIPTAMTLSTAASSISFLLMTLLILIPVYTSICKCSCCKKSNILSRVCCNSLCKVLKQGKVISPFEDKKNEDNKNTSTALTSDQALCFFSNYVLAILLLGISFASLPFGWLEYDKHPCPMNVIHFVSFVFRLFSRFCAIHSCFIFSKIIYIVTGQLDQVIEDMDKVNDEILQLLDKADIQCYFNVENEPVENESVDIKELLQSQDKGKQEMGRYYLLQNIDRKFIDRVKPILDLFGYWFIIHWVLYGLSTVLLTASVVELVVDVFELSPAYKVAKVVPIKDEHAGLKSDYIVYVVFYTLEHAYLFIYPCFRAASIAAAREKQIFAVSKKYWNHIPLKIKGHFIQYLCLQNFSFKAPILCTNVSFGFNWAFVSLFIAVCGGFSKF